MRFTIQKNILANALSLLQPFLEKKDASQMISHILIEAEETGVWLSAMDVTKGFRLFVSANVETTGAATANGTKLLSNVNALNNSVTIERVEDVVMIKSGRSRMRLDSFNELHFPKFPEVSETDKPLSTKAVRDASKVFFSADHTHPKPFFQGVFIGDDIVGSNGHLLSLVNNTELGLECIVPKHMIKAINDFNCEERYITVGDTNMIDRGLKHFIFSRVINDKYPNYKRIIDNVGAYSESISMPKTELFEALMLCKTAWHEVMLKFCGDKVEFHSLDPEKSVKTSISIETVNDVEIALNIGYVLGFLKEASSEYQMEFNKVYGAVKFNSEGLSSYIQPVVV